MARIAEILYDPAWWFSAVFIGVLASLLASFLKDVLRSALATVSSRYSARKKARDQLIQKEVDLLLRDPTLLLLTYCRLLEVNGFTKAFIIVWVVATLFWLTLPENAALDVKLMVMGLALMGGLLFILLNSLNSRRLEIVTKAYRCYRHKLIKAKGQIPLQSMPNISSEEPSN